MVRFCSESLLVVPVFFQLFTSICSSERTCSKGHCMYQGCLPWFHWCLDQIQLFFLFFLYIFQFWHFICDTHLVRDFILPVIRSSLVLQVSWSRSWVGFCCPGLDMNFSTIFCSIFIPIYLPKSLSLQLLQHLPWTCPVSCEGPCLQFSPLQTRIKPLYWHSPWGQGDFRDHKDRGGSLDSLNSQVIYSDGPRLTTSVLCLSIVWPGTHCIFPCWLVMLSDCHSFLQILSISPTAGSVWLRLQETGEQAAV